MKVLEHLFERNRAWAARVTAADPGFFERLARQQAPRLLWIGCSDSRVPANQIVDLPPGEVFVHRNVANLVSPGDANVHAVIEFAVGTLEVEHVIVCGHYGCGGVQAALSGGTGAATVDAWLGPLRRIAARHRAELDALAADGARVERLCELNVAAQIRNVCASAPVRRAWAEGRALTVHGWIYRIGDGLLQDLGLCVTGPRDPAASPEEP